MLDQMKQIWETYVSRYQRQLALWYPGEGSTGLAEANLTHNFLCAIEANCPSVLTWDEFQFQKRLHIDAIAIDMENKEILLVESKRQQSQRKADSSEKDRERMNEIAAHPEWIGERFYEDINIASFEIHSFVLGDIWVGEGQRDARARILDSYMEKADDSTVFLAHLSVKKFPDTMYHLFAEIDCMSSAD